MQNASRAWMGRFYPGISGFFTLMNSHQVPEIERANDTQVRLMHSDLNWASDPIQRAATPQDWAMVDAEEYFNWHMEFGTNAMYCQAYLFGGTALYPSRLGPVAPGEGSTLFPRLYRLARARGVPTWSYFCVGADLVMSNHRNEWIVPGTRILFNVPYHKPKESVWEGHPMVNESDGLFAECNRPEVLEWLLSVRRPGQRLMTTILGRCEPGECDPQDWRRWHEAGCDFFGYVWGAPPDFRPPESKRAELDVVRQAFREMTISPARHQGSTAQ